MSECSPLELLLFHLAILKLPRKEACFHEKQHELVSDTKKISQFQMRQIELPMHADNFLTEKVYRVFMSRSDSNGNIKMHMPSTKLKARYLSALAPGGANPVKRKYAVTSSGSRIG